MIKCNPLYMFLKDPLVCAQGVRCQGFLKHSLAIKKTLSNIFFLGFYYLFHKLCVGLQTADFWPQETRGIGLGRLDD